MWGAVLPEHRRQGIGDALWRANRDRLAAAAAADPQPGPRELRAYALDIEAADLALSRTRATSRSGYGFEMRRFLTGALPEHPLPDGHRAAAGAPRTSTGRSGTPIARRSATTGATASRARATSWRRFAAPEIEHRAVVGRVGR